MKATYNSYMKTFLASLATATLLLSLPSQAKASSITAITPAGGIERVEFKHHKMNLNSDFVAVTNTRVYVGNAKEKTLDLIMTNDSSNFVLGENITLQRTPELVYVYQNVFQTRLSLNSAGDFILASNNQLWLGNTRNKSINKVADGGSFTGFQTVLINDEGFYLAVGYEKIFGGKTNQSAATTLLTEAVGNFSTISLYESVNNIHGYTGEQRVALNKNGRFVALTGSAVYAGDISTGLTSLLLEERWGGFRHVSLADDDTFSLVSDNDIFAGTVLE